MTHGLNIKTTKVTFHDKCITIHLSLVTLSFQKCILRVSKKCINFIFYPCRLLPEKKSIISKSRKDEYLALNNWYRNT